MSPLPGIFQSAHLSYFPFTEGDFDLLRGLDTDPDVQKFLGNGKIKTEAETKVTFERIKSQTKKHGLSVYATHLRGNGLFIGRTGLIHWDLDGESVWEVGYTLHKKFWGKGLATEAAQFWKKTGFEMLNVPFLVSIIHPDNAASIKVATKNGMTHWKNTELNGAKVAVYKIART